MFNRVPFGDRFHFPAPRLCGGKHVVAAFMAGLAVFSAVFFSKAGNAQPPITPDSDPTHSGTVASTPGAPYPWVGSNGAINTGTGNVNLSIPLAGWINRGGMPVGFSLFYNSQAIGTTASLNSPKWSHSYDSRLVDNGRGKVTIFWDDGRIVDFAWDGNKYLTPVGIFDTLTEINANNSGTRYYEYVTSKGQIHFRFASGSANGLAGSYALSSISDRNNNTITINHANGNAGGPVTSITDSTNRTITVNRDNAGRIGSVTDCIGRIWYIAYNNANSIKEIAWPIVDGIDYHDYFDYNNVRAPGNYPYLLRKHTDSRGKSTFWEYFDEYGAIKQVTDPCGNTIKYDYGRFANPSQTTTVVTDPNNWKTTLTYFNDKLIGTTDPLGFSDSYNYSPTTNIVNQMGDRRNPRNYSSVSSNSSTGNVEWVTTPKNESSGTTYNARNQPLTITDPLGHGVTFGYDEATTNVGNLLSVTDAKQHKTTIQPGAFGLTWFVRNHLGDTTSFGYDNHGYANYVTDPNGNHATAVYNPLGWLYYLTDGMGNTTLYGHDEWGRVNAVLKQSGSQIPLYRVDAPNALDRLFIAYESDRLNLMAAGWLSRGVVGYVYLSSSEVPNLRPLYMLESTNNQHVYTTSADEKNAWIAAGMTYRSVAGYAYAPNQGGGKPNFYRAYNAATQQYFYTVDASEYNALSSAWRRDGAICSFVGQAGNLVNSMQITYDGNSNVLSTQDANGNRVENTYDACNRLLTTTRRRSMAAADTDTVSYHYDEPGQHGLLSYKINANGKRTTYNYTERNQLKYVVYPGNTSESWIYDENGNILNHTDANGYTTHFHYDQNNRLDIVGHPNEPNSVLGTNFGFVYDSAGRMTQMTDEQGQTNWNYDELNRVLQMSTSRGRVNFAYDDDHRKVQRSVNGGPTWTYTYDPAGRLSTLNTPWNTATTFTYDAADRLVQQINGNGIVTAYAYDMQGHIAGIRNRTSIDQPYFNFAYTYDAGGRVTSQTYSDGTRTTFAYDGEDQLINETRNNGYSLSYTYDHNGNRLTRQATGSTGNWTENYTYESGDSDRLHSMVSSTGYSKSYAYDNNGNVKVVWVNGQIAAQMGYDHENKLVTYIRGDGLVNANRYNAMGLRVFRQDSAASFNQVFDGAGVGSSLLYDGTNTYYTQGIDEWRYGQTKFVLGDALGSMVNLTDSSQNVTDGAIYEAFGNLLGRGGNTDTPFLFGGGAGYQTEKDSGLMLLGHRFYDASIGRFISRDPIGAGENWYTYASNNPTMSLDPLGLQEGYSHGSYYRNGQAVSENDYFRNGQGYSDPNHTDNGVLGTLANAAVGWAVRQIFGGGGGSSHSAGHATLTPHQTALWNMMSTGGPQMAEFDEPSGMGPALGAASGNVEGLAKLLSMSDPAKMITAGRWMSEVEFNKMVETGHIQPSWMSGDKNMSWGTVPPFPDGFKNPKPIGNSVFAEWEMANEQWHPQGGASGTKSAVFWGPNNHYAVQAARQGKIITGMPKVHNPRITGRK